jgi:hypothetical protein
VAGARAGRRPVGDRPLTRITTCGECGRDVGVVTEVAGPGRRAGVRTARHHDPRTRTWCAGAGVVVQAGQIRTGRPQRELRWGPNRARA